jgi:vacuolar-type H+-ATPase subunit I/STV1
MLKGTPQLRKHPVESLGRKLEAAVDKIEKEINSNIPKNEDDVSQVNLEDKEVEEACEEGSTEKVEDFDNLGRRLVEAVDKMANELNCKNKEKYVCSVDVSEDKIENSEREVVTVIEERYELRKEAKQQIKEIHEENIKNYNRKRKMAREYKPGDQVSIKRKRTQFKTNAKILPKYLGRYEVIKKIGNDRYHVKKIGTHDGPRTTKSCAEMMKPWCQEDLDSFEANEFQDGRGVGNG